MRSGHAFVVDCNFRFVLVSPTSKASILPLMMSCIMRPVVLYLAQLIRAYSVLYLIHQLLMMYLKLNPVLVFDKIWIIYFVSAVHDANISSRS